MMVPGGVVLDPQPRPRNRRGLLAVAPPLVFTPDANRAAGGPGQSGWPRWTRGFQWEPYACGAVGPVPVGCIPTPEAGDGAKETPANAGVRTFLPYLLLGADECSVMDVGRDRQGRANANLEATASHQVEAALWSGSFQGLAGVEDDYDDNPFLADGDATDVGTFGVTQALAALEQELAECLHGARGMVHVPPAVASLLHATGQLVVDAGQVVTVNDNLVVVGSGYAPPAGGVATIYGTSLVYVARGPATPVAGQAGEQVNRATNDWPFLVEQPAAAVWDGCCTLSVDVTMAETGLDTAT